MSDQNVKNETATVSEELFMEELGQVHGGQVPPVKLPIRPISFGLYEVEVGPRPPVLPLPLPRPKPKPLTQGLLENLPFPLPRF